MAANGESPAENEHTDMEYPTCLGALSLLPIEMWENILERVEESTDIRNFCRAWKYPDWDVILHRTKASWLFSEIFPHVFKYLSTKEQVLVCRLVCKRWCKSVDNFLENNPCRRPSLPQEKNPHYTRLGILAKALREKGLLQTNFSSGKILKIQTNHVSSITRNPIIGRSANFNWSQENPSSEILPFLSQVGHHIWDFRIEIHADSPLQFFQTLQKYLELVPNLKRLEIFGETTLVIEQTVESNLQALKSQGISLPQLLHLETLDASIFDQYREKIMEILLTSYSQNLRRLNLNNYKIPLSSHIKLQNLTELTLSLDSDNQLEPFPSLTLPHLRRLTVYIIRNSQRGGYPDFSKLFQTISRCFSETLEALLVEFPLAYTAVQWSQQSALPTLTLPHLKTLELKDGTFHSFNFICQLKSLESLHLYKYRWAQRVGMTQQYEVGIDLKEILDLKNILDKPSQNNSQRLEALYGSNLWKVLPRLKLFTLSKASNLRTATQNVEQYYRRQENILNKS